MTRHLVTVRFDRPLWAVVALFTLAACVPASPDQNTYEAKTSLTVGGALSDVATVRIILEALHENKILRAAAIAQIRASEDSLDTNAGAYAEVNPPPALDALYTRTSMLLSDATDLVTQARIAIDRHRSHRYPKIAQDLAKTATQLDKIDKNVS
jgi:hypothetical protein